MQYRCKTRKPNGEIVDGCGYQTDVAPVGSSKCPNCAGVGFLRQVGEVRDGESAVFFGTHSGGVSGAGAGYVNPDTILQIAERVQARLLDRSQLNVDRTTVLRAVLSNTRALLIATLLPHPEGVTNEENTCVAETLTLLRALLPANATADRVAQVTDAGLSDADRELVKKSPRLLQLKSIAEEKLGVPVGHAHGPVLSAVIGEAYRIGADRRAHIDNTMAALETLKRWADRKSPACYSRTWGYDVFAYTLTWQGPDTLPPEEHAKTIGHVDSCRVFDSLELAVKAIESGEVPS